MRKIFITYFIILCFTTTLLHSNQIKIEEATKSDLQEITDIYLHTKRTIFKEITRAEDPNFNEQAYDVHVSSINRRRFELYLFSSKYKLYVARKITQEIVVGFMLLNPLPHDKETFDTLWGEQVHLFWKNNTSADDSELKQNINELEQQTSFDDKSIWVDMLFIHPNFMQQGIGKQSESICNKAIG